MKGSGKFKTIDTKSYEAVALPTEDGSSFIIALPKDKNSLSDIESEIVKSGISMNMFVEAILTSKTEEDVNVMIPRLGIQIVHEWSTPSSRVSLLLTLNTNLNIYLKRHVFNIFYHNSRVTLCIRTWMFFQTLLEMELEGIKYRCIKTHI